MDVHIVNAIIDAIRSVSKRTLTMAITGESRFIEDLVLDSLDLVGVLMKLEDEFGLQIDLDEVPNIQTVADLAQHIETLRVDRASAA